MTQEDKQLLLADLCARLSYGVQCEVSGRRYGPYTFVGDDVEDLMEGRVFKPYLRPMSSMTEEEKEELSHLLPKDWSVEIDKLNNFYFDMSPSIFMEIDVFLNIIDWLNAHHFDYRGLIEKGLAIAVTEENNPYKE